MMKKLWNQYSYAIILIIFSFSTALMISLHSNDQKHYLKVTVSEGDSLWKISQHFSDQHSLSNKEFVTWVKKHNKIEGDHIFPGEGIIIPVSKTAPSSTEFASGVGE
jgi:cell division protein YceG involved in septum cleavage